LEVRPVYGVPNCQHDAKGKIGSSKMIAVIWVMIDLLVIMAVLLLQLLLARMIWDVWQRWRGKDGW